MAERHIIELIDDLDNTPIGEAGGRHTFALDNRTWEIDLSAENVEKLREALAPFIKVGRRPSSTTDKTASASIPKGRARSQDETNAIREWARSNGYEVSNRGRIAESTIQAYHVAASRL